MKLKAKYEEAKANVRAKLERVEHLIKPTGIDYTVWGVTALGMVAYFHNQKRKQIIATGEAAKQDLHHMAEDMERIANIMAEEAMKRNNSANVIGECVANDRDFKYIPGLGVIIAGEGKKLSDIKKGMSCG